MVSKTNQISRVNIDKRKCGERTIMAPVSDIIYRLRPVLLLPGALWSLFHDFGITELLDVVVDECWQIRSKRLGRWSKVGVDNKVVRDLRSSVSGKLKETTNGV